MSLNVLHPVGYVLEGGAVGAVVAENNSVSVSVVRRGYLAEALLAGGVPDLEKRRREEKTKEKTKEKAKTRMERGGD